MKYWLAHVQNTESMQSITPFAKIDEPLAKRNGLSTLVRDDIFEYNDVWYCVVRRVLLGGDMYIAVKTISTIDVKEDRSINLQRSIEDELSGQTKRSKRKPAGKSARRTKSSE